MRKYCEVRLVSKSGLASKRWGNGGGYFFNLRPALADTGPIFLILLFDFLPGFYYWEGLAVSCLLLRGGDSSSPSPITGLLFFLVVMQLAWYC